MNRIRRQFAILAILQTLWILGCNSEPKITEVSKPETAPPLAPLDIKTGKTDPGSDGGIKSVNDLSKMAQDADLKAIKDKSTPAIVQPAPIETAPIVVAPPSIVSAPKVTVAHVEEHKRSSGVSPEQSLKWLTNGNIRFVKGSFRADGRKTSDRARLSKGQQPHAIIVSCSDSRVPPEHVFDQALGEIFVIRTAGEALSDASIASIEYAVEHLGSNLVLVMGHTNCGAVKLAVETKEGQLSGSSAVDALIADIKPRLQTVKNDPVSKDFEVEGALNADGVARDLIKRSETLRKRVASGEIKIKSALYNLDSGKVSFY